MLVEDSEDDRDMMRFAFRKAGCRILFASYGGAARRLHT